MKRILIILVIGFVVQTTFAQKKIIDIKTNLISLETTVPAKKLEIEIVNASDDKKYKITSVVDIISYDPLSIPKVEDDKGVILPKSAPFKKLEFNLRNGEQAIVTIQEFDLEGKKTKEITRKYITKPRGKWQTTFGFNMVWINADTYFSQQQEDDTFTISPSNRDQSLEFHPTIMFTWLGFGKEEKEIKDWNIGGSAGLGYDLENSFSVFTGLSFVYNQNITFTLGAAFINQEELNGQYEGGETITENLDFDQLHKDFLRVRPFVSISLRLDKSPF